MAAEQFPTDLKGEYIEHNHLLNSDKAGWEKLSLMYEVEPAGEMPEAIATSHILVVCLGDFQASFQRDRQWHHEQYTKGDIVIVAAGELFPRVRVDREVPLLDLFLSADALAEGIGATIPSKTQLRSHLRLRDPLIQQMALALKTELEIAGEDSKLYADSMATALGTHLLTRYGVKTSVKNYQGGLTPSQLKIVVEYIQANLDGELNSNNLSNLIHISPHYFASLFKQSTGLSPYKYITQSRLEKAKELLRDRNLPIVFICQEVGFKNQSHFTRVFRQHFKITPKAYRDLF